MAREERERYIESDAYVLNHQNIEMLEKFEQFLEDSGKAAGDHDPHIL